MTNKVVTGAAIGTLLGAIAIALFPKRKSLLEALSSHGDELGSKAKDYANFLVNKSKMLTHHHEEEDLNKYWKASVAGLLMGVGLTLFLAPKNGKQFRDQITKVYDDLFKKTASVISDFKNNNHPIFTAKKTVQVKKRKKLSKAKP